MLIIAHRGASEEFPENSILAIEQAIAQNADGIEIDLQYHRQSQQFVLLHDRCVSNITDQATGDINQFSLEQLTQFSIGQEQTLTTLSQAFSAMNSQLLINLELKSLSTNKDEIVEQISQLKIAINKAVKADYINDSNIIISAFNHHLLPVCQQLLPQVKTAALVAHCPIDFAKIGQSLNSYGINQDIACLNEAFVEDAHQRGLQVWVYTVDSDVDISFCYQCGVDGIFTNRPSKTRTFLEQNFKERLLN